MNKYLFDKDGNLDPKMIKEALKAIYNHAYEVELKHPVDWIHMDITIGPEEDKPKEAECKQCSKMNDLGSKECWWCGTKDPVS